MNIKLISKLVLSISIGASLNSCYTTPGTYSSPSIESKSLAKKSGIRFTNNKTLRPTVKFPARIAFARINSHSGNHIELINNREYETPEHAKIIASLPNIAGVTHISSTYLPSTTTNLSELRKATRRLGASMLAVYQFNTSTRTTNGSTILSVATLGAAPMAGNKAFANVSLTFIDAKTGYIYGVLEESASTKRISSSWGAGNARKNAIVKANEKAIDKLMKRLPDFWQRVYTR